VNMRLLAANRVYHLRMSPYVAVSFYLTLFTFSASASTDGSIVSMALSLEFPPVAVSNCPSLCSPDFPPTFNGGRSVSNLAGIL
jgi:hypothetical protein